MLPQRGGASWSSRALAIARNSRETRRPICAPGKPRGSLFPGWQRGGSTVRRLLGFRPGAGRPCPTPRLQTRVSGLRGGRRGAAPPPAAAATCERQARTCRVGVVRPPSGLVGSGEPPGSAWGPPAAPRAVLVRPTQTVGAGAMRARCGSRALGSRGRAAV